MSEKKKRQNHFLSLFFLSRSHFLSECWGTTSLMPRKKGNTTLSLRPHPLRIFRRFTLNKSEKCAGRSGSSKRISPSLKHLLSVILADVLANGTSIVLLFLSCFIAFIIWKEEREKKSSKEMLELSETDASSVSFLLHSLRAFSSLSSKSTSSVMLTMSSSFRLLIGDRRPRNFINIDQIELKRKREWSSFEDIDPNSRERWLILRTHWTDR